MTRLTPDNFPRHQWMHAAPEIDNLSLNELTLPGTHNAGCDWEASWSNAFIRNWYACQDVSFYSQLNRGSRALDVRLIFDPSATGLAKFRFQHNGHWSSRTLADLIRDIKAFLERSYNEFIILDFHQLQHGDTRFDFKYFNDVMLESLGEYIIPTQHKDYTIGQLKNISRLQRVLVTAPNHPELDWKFFGSQIRHEWAGNDAGTIVTDTLERLAVPASVSSRLEAFITTVLKHPRDNLEPWSLSAAVYDAGGPLRMLEVLDKWFDPANSDWAEKCSIINFDFIKSSNLVYFCYLANLKKAGKKSAHA